MRSSMSVSPRVTGVTDDFSDGIYHDVAHRLLAVKTKNVIFFLMKKEVVQVEGSFFDKVDLLAVEMNEAEFGEIVGPGSALEAKDFEGVLFSDKALGFAFPENDNVAGFEEFGRIYFIFFIFFHLQVITKPRFILRVKNLTRFFGALTIAVRTGVFISNGKTGKPIFAPLDGALVGFSKVALLVVVSHLHHFEMLLVFVRFQLVKVLVQFTTNSAQLFKLTLGFHDDLIRQMNAKE